MKPYSIADNFNQYFKIRFAGTKELAEEAYKIRYGVYSKELGWEPTNSAEMETDKYDKFSFHCILEHRRTGTFAGCIRLVIPPTTQPDIPLPFEVNCLSSHIEGAVDTRQLPRGGFGEISRLAVLESFRRRDKEKNIPFVLKEVDMNTIYSEDERRNFPNIAMGLYLSGLAMAAIFKHIGIIVMMEPRLNRRLIRFGLPFKQIGKKMDYHGSRAMFYLPRNQFYTELNPELTKLYEILHHDLSQEITLKDFGKNTPFKIPDIDLTK